MKTIVYLLAVGLIVAVIYGGYNFSNQKSATSDNIENNNTEQNSSTKECPGLLPC